MAARLCEDPQRSVLLLKAGPNYAHGGHRYGRRMPTGASCSGESTSDWRGYRPAGLRPLFEEYVASLGLKDRVKFRTGDFFKDPLPGADVLMMRMILHDWNLDVKQTLSLPKTQSRGDGAR